MSFTENIILLTGGFDPVHRGYIEYFKEASLLGKVVIGLNSDAWLMKKKWKPFMKWEERKGVLEEMRSVWIVIPFEDDDVGTACGAIQEMHKMFPDATLLFGNGGDRKRWGDNQVSREERICDELRVKIIYGLGKSGKIQSSSILLKNWKEE